MDMHFFYTYNYFILICLYALSHKNIKNDASKEDFC